MYLDQFLGKTVILNIREEFLTTNASFFQRKHGKLIYARIQAADELGIWIEHPAWETHPVGQTPETHKLHFLIPWQFIAGIGAFPERVFNAERAEAEAAPIGFKLE